MSKKKSGTFQIGRDAGNGQFIPVKKAIKMGDKAVVETMNKGKKKP